MPYLAKYITKNLLFQQLLPRNFDHKMNTDPSQTSYGDLRWRLTVLHLVLEVLRDRGESRNNLYTLALI